MTSEEKQEALHILNERELTSCIAQSDLYKGTKQTVPGAGNPDANIMVIGEAPGKKEDELGVPFMGAAGKFLNELLESINLRREDIFIANCIKHRPPENRDPSPQEIAVYGPWLQGQIDIIDPKVIITLGRFSMEFVLGPGFSISKVHGQQKEKNGRVIVPMYHPAAALYRGDLRPVLKEDFQKIPKILALLEK